MERLTYPTSPPSNPVAGNAWIDLKSKTISVFDGSKWVEFTERQLIEMEIMQLLVMAGHPEEEATYMINIIKNSNGQN